MSEAFAALAPAGTIPRRCIEHLQTLPPGSELPTAALADHCGQPTAGFSKYLRLSAGAGLLASRREGHTLMWRLGTQFAHRHDMKLPTNGFVDPERTVKRVPAQAAPSIFAYAASIGAAPFSVSVSTDGRLRIERYGRLIAELTDTERRQVIVAAAQGVIPA